jgi:hypothetical protein
MVLRRPSGFIEPCQPSKVARPPSGPLWVHEIKHDGYRLMVRRDGARVRCFTRNGHDWADRFPAIVDAAHRIKASSFLIDGEAVKFTNEHQRSQTGPRDRIASHAANTGGRRAWPRVRLPTAIGIPLPLRNERGRQRRRPQSRCLCSSASAFFSSASASFHCSEPGGLLSRASRQAEIGLLSVIVQTEFCV